MAQIVASGRIRIGTSDYGELGAGRALRRYARRFDSVECASRKLRPEEVEGWRESTPRDFSFSLRVPREITHLRRLADCQNVLRPWLDALELFHDKLGPLLFQLPLTWNRGARDEARLEAFLDSLPPSLRIALELQNPSWHVDSVLRILCRYRVALVLPLEPARALLRETASVRTCDFAYLRSDGARGSVSDARVSQLRRWSAEGTDVYVFVGRAADARKLTSASSTWSQTLRS